MKKLAVLFGVLLAALPCAAQLDFVSVELLLGQEQYLPNEPIIARVRIQNSSGQTLKLGDDPTWLTFVVETIEGPYVRQLKMPDVKGEFSLGSSYTATKEVDLAPIFKLTERGKYKVIATVKVPAFNNTAFASPAKSFYIGNGTKRWEKAFGVPATIAPPGADGQPETRKYVLVETNPGSESKLFVRVTNPQDENLRVVMIGPMVSISKPEPQLDRWSNLHVLYQVGAKAFLYTELNPEGLVLARERHDYSDTRPTLWMNEDGRISVRGGMRRYTNEDVPPVEPSVALAPTEPEGSALMLNPPAATKGDQKKKAGAANGNDAKEKKKK
jgi:hypothetical protein